MGLKRSRFEQIYQEGKVVRGNKLRMLSLPGSGSVGFATARSIGCHARRNRALRRAKAALAMQPGALNKRLDYVISVQASSDKAPFSELVTDLAGVLELTTKKWADASESS